MNPHDLAPSWINAETDWLSLAGNAASILALLISIGGLIITLLVKRQVSGLGQKYALRYRGRVWSKRIAGHAESLLGYYKAEPFAEIDARVELTKVRSLIKLMSERLPAPLSRNAREVLGNINQTLGQRFWHKPRTLERERSFELYLILVDLSQNLQHSATPENYPL